MRVLKLAVLAAAAGIMFVAAQPKVMAQISVEVGIAPDCPYGYFDYAPYNCVPDGYYGSEWFNGGVFIGAGPWFHGDEHFQGNVDNSLDPQHGYNGPSPKAGDKAAAVRRDPSQFKGNEMRDGRGHTSGPKK
jgi:hypothetical protein